jgi:hypothetical protein
MGSFGKAMFLVVSDWIASMIHREGAVTDAGPSGTAEVAWDEIDEATSLSEGAEASGGGDAEKPATSAPPPKKPTSGGNSNAPETASRARDSRPSRERSARRTRRRGAVPVSGGKSRCGKTRIREVPGSDSETSRSCNIRIAP